MEILYPPHDAVRLAESVAKISEAARVLAAFGEADPGLASECGVEINALEARTILASGAPARVAARAVEAARTGRPAAVSAQDLEALSRLEAVVALGKSRIDLRLAALEAEASQEPLSRLAGLAGLATGAVGLIKSIL
jgi:hypothetical protein